MRTFWICLFVSLALHVLFFPQVLGSLIHSGEAESQQKAPDRVQIRMVKKKKPPVEVKKPKPKPVVKKPQPQPKPKVEQPKPQPKPVVKPPEPKPAPKPAAKPVPQPKPKTRPQPSYPKAPPKPSYPKSAPSYPKSKPQPPKSKPSQSQQRLNKKGGKKTPGGVKVPTPDQPSGGKTGLDPNGNWRKPSDPVGDPNGTPNGTGTAPAPPAPQPAPPAPKPAPPAPKPAPPAPKPAPPAPKPAPPKPKPAPSARKEIISVPTIDPPAKFRREKLKGQLWVRFKIEADGSFTVSLFESSGNPEFDDFVLEEVRRTAQVQPAIGDDGQPKSSRPRRPVDINID